MAVALSGTTLTLDEVVRVARARERVEIVPGAFDDMGKAREVIEKAVSDGTPVYGVTTGVGMRRDARVERAELSAFNRSAIAGHRVGLGQAAAEDVVRASLLRLTNGLVAGYQGARPELAQLVVDALNENRVPEVRSLGTLGQADLAQNADLAHGILGDFELAAGEAGALLVTNAFSTGQAALAIADARTLLESFDAAAALDFEGFRGNVGALHAVVGETRPYPGVRQTLARLRHLLEGSALWEPGGPTISPGSTDVPLRSSDPRSGP